MTRQELGTWGEVYVASRLRERGYCVAFGNKGVDSDLKVEYNGKYTQIEIKTATQGKDRKWRATLIKTGHTDHNKSDVLIFVCQNKEESTFFVVPTRDIKDRRHMVITSNPRTYTGRWSQYRRESLVNRRESLVI